MQAFKNIHELNIEFEKIKEDDYLSYITFHEENLHSIEQIEIEKDTAHFQAKLRLLSEYGLSLVSTKRYSDAIPNLENSIQLFESSKKESQLKPLSYFQGILYNYGLALFHVNRTNEALSIFKRLLQNDPKNEKCKSWIQFCKVTIAKKYTKPAWIACLTWILGDLTVFKYFTPEVQFILTISGTFIVLAGVGIELFIYLSKVKYRAISKD